MAQLSLYDMFLNLLRDIFSAESQIVDQLPGVIQSVSHNDLKEALTHHFDETKTQVQRLKQIFKILNENPTGKTCAVIETLFNEIHAEVKQEASSAVKDASLIIFCQKIEHYELTSYGSARAIARHLHAAGLSNNIDFDDIADILQQSLDEESLADEKLTDIAEGGFFTQGINDEAEEQAAAMNQQNPMKNNK